MRKAIFTLLCIISGPFIFAKQLDPVHWQFKAEKMTENTYDLHFTAYVNQPYHIYSQDNNADVTLPTKLEFTRNPLVELTGNTKETGELETESISGATLKYYENRVEFVQTIKLKAAVKVSVSGKINYMACTNGRCLPPTEHRFSFAL
jgi:Disulphide bond corrector protein DsbC